MELELGGFDGNYTLEENIRQFFHVWVEGTKRIATCQHFMVFHLDAARYLPSRHDRRSAKSGSSSKDIGRLRAEGGLEKDGFLRV